MSDRHELACVGLRAPEPSADLRLRTLDAARTALGRAEGADIWARIWTNRTARLAWAASVGCLLFGHVVLNNGSPAEPAPRALPIAVFAEIDNELSEVATLPRLTTHLPGFEIARVGLETTSPADGENEESS